jgi:hypothetical protein
LISQSRGLGDVYKRQVHLLVAQVPGLESTCVDHQQLWGFGEHFSNEHNTSLLLYLAEERHMAALAV